MSCHQHPRLHRSLVGFATLSVLTLAACGGGGGDDDGGATSRGSGSALAFSQAPALPAAPSPLPVANSLNVCEEVRFGNRDIENLQVPDNATCVLDPGVRINGNLELGTGSRLFARGITVGGNIQGQRADVAVVEASAVGGSVQLDIGGSVALRELGVTGSIQLVNNRGAIELESNRVGADIQLFENRGGVLVNGSQVDGNMQCKENVPAPTGSGNRAASKEDQCSAL
jgi:hypothetical protein